VAIYVHENSKVNLHTGAEPRDYLKRITRPFLHLSAKVDSLSGPPEEHEAAFATATAKGKELVTLSLEHTRNYFEGFEANMKAQLDFLEKHM
jgi:hypothetical protein